MSEQNQDNPRAEKEAEENNWWQPAVFVFARMSAWIIAPVLLGLFLGKWLDQKYGTAPWMFLGVTGLAFIFSMIGLILEATKEFKKIANDKNKGVKKKEDSK